ncbi:uncharacterized protein LOC135839488 [Planococcus citri]|uniref:uncharacterized protein LOC135839488 n=1 Tax=Planococcus citri TaxID=170843 RepID=UPI0031F98F08
MSNTTGVFCRSSVLVLIIFISCLTVSYSLPTTGLDESKDLISNNTDGSCVRLSSTPSKFVKYKCNGEYSEDCTFGKLVPEHTVVKILCNPGYYSLNDDGSNETTSVCIEKKWIPANVRCHKTCDRLYSNHMNINLECFHGNRSIPCEENSLTTGTTVRSSCKCAHKYEKSKRPYQEIHCGEDGKWDAALIPCISGCEKRSTNNPPFDAPWHVTIVYADDKVKDKEIKPKCAGTIISPRLILTVESCVHHDISNEFKGDANASKYAVSVTEFPLYQRVHEIAEFRYFNQTKFIHKVNRIYTPMILVLKEKIVFDAFVSPAYIQWDSPSRMDMRNGTVKISEVNTEVSRRFSFFGTSTWKYPEMMDIFLGTPTSKSVNFSSHNACKERWAYPFFASIFGPFLALANENQDIKDTVLYDENLMCLEYENDFNYVLGSGVIVEENNCHFIRGIMGPAISVSKFITNIDEVIGKDKEASTVCDDSVTLKSPKQNEIRKFWCEMRNRVKKSMQTAGKNSETRVKIAGSMDIADYVGWIKKIRDEVETQ